MEHKSILKLLVLFLGFSFVVSSAAAVPTSRSLKSFKDDLPVQDLLAQGETGMRIDGELSEVSLEGRMDEEIGTDYDGKNPAKPNKRRPPPFRP